MIELKDLKTLWKEDCRIDEILLDKSTLEIPVRHSRWLDLHHDCKTQLRKLESLKKGFKMGDRRGNPDYEKIVEAYAETEQCIEYSAECLSFLNKTSYHIGNCIRWRAFSSGVDIP